MAGGRRRFGPNANRIHGGTVKSRSGSSIAVHKFGGASLADPPGIASAVELVRSLPGTPVVVVSALAGVTDGLLAAIAHAGAGDGRRARKQAQALRARYLAAARGVL